MIRALGRFWFVIPLLLAVTILQLGVGFIIARTVINKRETSATPLEENIVIVSTSPEVEIPQPWPSFTSTSTPTPKPSARPTFTPSPTRTPTRMATDTPRPRSSATSSSTPTPTNTASPTLQPTPLGSGRTLTVPILMYHYLSSPPSDANAIRLDLSVRPEQFETHLAYLRQAGYETISMKQLAFALSGLTDLPPKPIILTFDDGYRDNYEYAFPTLRKYGYSATFFIFTQPIDTQNINYISWDMVIEMDRAGMEFGSHSYSHPDMSGRGIDFLVFETLASKEAIEERTGEPVRFFAYPSGQYDNLTSDVIKSANFWGAVTTQWGATQSYDDRFEMTRVRINGTDTAADLAQKLSIFED